MAILSALGVSFDSVAAGVDERPEPGEPPRLLARRLARAKALVAARLYPDRVALGADTVVVLDHTSLGKPAAASAASAMLRSLRAREHSVITAVSTARWDGKTDGEQPLCWTRHATTRVWMRDYSDAEIEAYVRSGDPFDKAGSYAIQNEGFHPVARLDGCYLNVVGLPPRQTREVLLLAGAEIGQIQARQLEIACPGCHEVSALVG